MALSEAPTTGPKPFVLVLMPFKKEFNDTYTFGIKGAAEDVGAYAERIDEQIFQEGILDRVFNQINKADVVVADMTGQNANVFYEVGYAHALNKIVLLITRDANDIPFDLKHRQHIVYGGEIATLRSELAKRLKWAIEESRRRQEGSMSELSVRCCGIPLPEVSVGSPPPVIEFGSPKILALIGNIFLEPLKEEGKVRFARIPCDILNTGRRRSAVLEVSLFMNVTALLEPIAAGNQLLSRFPASESDESKLGLSWQYPLPVTSQSIPPNGAILVQFFFRRSKEISHPTTIPVCLRIQTENTYLDFVVHLKLPITT